MIANDTQYEEYKLRGFAVGNGCTNWKYDVEPGWVDTLYGFDMIPKSLYDNIKAAGCNYNHTFSPYKIPGECGLYWNQTQNDTATLNYYDLYRIDPKRNGTDATEKCPKSVMYGGSDYALF